MNIYIEYHGMRDFKKMYQKLSTLFADSQNAYIVVFTKRVSLRPYHYLRNQRVRIIEYNCVLNSSVGKAIRLSNRKSNRIILSLMVKNSALKYRKKLQTIKHMTIIEDQSGVENDTIYEQNKYLIANTPKNNAVEQAEALHFIVFGYHHYDCMFSSCLKHNLYINGGVASFCPKHPEQSIIGNIFIDTDVFTTDAFVAILNKMVEKRRNCIAKCDFYDCCYGGCVFIDDCQKYQNLIRKAEQTYDEIMLNRTNLNDVRYYVKEVIVKEVCAVRKY